MAYYGMKINLNAGHSYFSQNVKMYKKSKLAAICFSMKHIINVLNIFKKTCKLVLATKITQ